MNIKNLRQIIIGGALVVIVASLLTLIFHLIDTPDHAKKHHITSNVPTSNFEPNLDISYQNQPQSELIAKVEDLEQKLADLSRTQNLMPITDADIEDDSGDISRSEEEKEEELEALWQEELNLLEETLRSEPVDNEWSEVAVSSLYESFENDEADGLELINAECHSTFCRLDLVFDLPSPEDSFRALQETLPWYGEMIYEAENSANGQSFAYISRQGYSLPSTTQ